MAKDAPRRASVNITYMKAGDGSNNSDSTIAEYDEGFTYTDPASGEADTISIKLLNMDLRWADKWMPQKGDKITAQISQEGWEDAGKQAFFSCGKFCVDDLSLSGPVLTCTIKGVSVPEANAFRSTERSKTWKDVTLKEVGAEIAGEYHLELSYTGSAIKLGTVEQSSESDSSFLQRVCQDYGLALKIYYGKIIIYDKGIFEAKGAVATIDASEMQDWSYNSTLVGTYTGATIKYTTGSDDQELTCVVGSGKRMLNINEKVENLQEAQIKACARVNTENEKAETMSVTIMANTRIVAGSTVNITGLRQVDGKYFVDKATHNIEAEGAYIMNLALHKCQARVAAASALDVVQGQETEAAQETLAVGDKVIVNGPAYWGGNGGKANQCSSMTMYITEILDSSYQYRYGVAKRRGGTRFGWCEEGCLTKA